MVHTATRTTNVQGDLRRIKLAGTLGLFVEFYDYAIYGFLAATIATIFFPAEDEAVGVILTYAVFAVTFVMRPLGGVVFGALADRHGRRTVLVITLTIMTGATTIIGLLPGYASIGIAAPLLVLAMRLLQGLSTGGEIGAAFSFVGEHAPSTSRARVMSWGQVGGFLALLFGSGLAAALTAILGDDAMGSWGWRVPFLIAAPLGLVGYYIRSRLEDTPYFQELVRKQARATNPVKETFLTKKNISRLLIAVLLPLLNGSGYYVLFIYMPTYLTKSLNFTSAQGLTVTACSLVAIIAAIPVMARLSDRHGRKPMLIWSAIAMAVLAYPGYKAMTLGNVGAAILGAMLLAIVFAGHAAIIHVSMVELFPTRVRNTSYGIGYNVSTALFGGAAPLLMTALIASTGSTDIPAFYVILTAIGTAITTAFISEAAGRELEQ